MNLVRKLSTMENVCQNLKNFTANGKKIAAAGMNYKYFNYYYSQYHFNFKLISISVHC